MQKFSHTKLMFRLYRRILPVVHQSLSYWQSKANQIPNQELRKQAQNSIKTKSFHCEGGSVFVFLLNQNIRNYIEFVVAFQTMSDYLDNLCDRSIEQDEKHFRQLHLAMSDALKPSQKLHDYYQYGQNQEDGGYLSQLVLKCQDCLANCSGYHLIQEKLLHLNGNYVHLQVYKHLHPDIREEKLKKWIGEINDSTYEWYQFAAAAGSTLGIFVFVAYAMNGDLDRREIHDLYRVYFPYIQGFHILLDYYIDRHEDEVEGDLNFCTYFNDADAFYQHMYALYEQVSQMHTQIRAGAFHMMILQALLGMYLADEKIQPEMSHSHAVKQLLNMGGKESRFFYRQVRIYKKLHKGAAFFRRLSAFYSDGSKGK